MTEQPAAGQVWPSGVGGVQCATCYRTTVCREIDGDWTCRPCWEGYDDGDE